MLQILQSACGIEGDYFIEKNTGLGRCELVGELFEIMAELMPKGRHYLGHAQPADIGIRATDR